MTNFTFKTKGDRVVFSLEFDLTEDKGASPATLLQRLVQSIDMQIDPDPKGENLIEALTIANCLSRFVLSRALAEFTNKTFKVVDDRCGKPLVELNKSVVTK